MAKAEIISIGTELLLGEIVDTNSQKMARMLREVGVDLYWMSTIGDNRARIAQAVREGLERADILLCTGGLGPTVDDVSREGIADGLGLELEYQEALWRGIQARFRNFGREASENNKRQAYVPQGARVLENRNGSAPAFLVEQDGKVGVSMPGVPREMLPIMEEQVLPYLVEGYADRAVIKARILRTAAVGESLIDEKIADLEELSNPTVGLAAHLGAVDIRLTAKAQSEAEATEMLDGLEAEVRGRLGEWIFGVDEETQESAIAVELARLGWQLAVFHEGPGLSLRAVFGTAASLIEEGQHEEELVQKASDWQAAGEGRVALVGTQSARKQFHFRLLAPSGSSEHPLSYGGEGEVAQEWGAKQAAEIVRRALIRQ